MIYHHHKNKKNIFGVSDAMIFLAFTFERLLLAFQIMIKHNYAVFNSTALLLSDISVADRAYDDKI